MLIVIEGPDCGGKTTLTHQLLLAHGGPGHREHAGPPADPPPCAFTEYESALDEPGLRARIADPRYLVVMDRWHVGEAVYGPLWRGTSRLDAAGLLHVEHALTAVGAVRVACLPPYPALRARFLDRGDDLTKLDELPQIHAEYAAHAQRFGHWVVDGTEDRERLLGALLSLARVNARQAAAVQLTTNRTYVGPLVQPRALLVGDERNAGPRPDLRRPFTPVNGSGCSRWLWDAVLATGEHNAVGAVNSNEPNVDLRALWAELSFPNLVALGGKASQRLGVLGLGHRTVHHPQFAKRFQNKRFNEYVASLTGAIHAETEERVGAH